MSSIRISAAWLLTITIGSASTGLYVGIPQGITAFGFIFLVSFVFSTICSFPTFAALMIVQYINAGKDNKTQLKWINVTHITMFLLTITLGHFYGGYGFVGITSYYAVVAVVVWVVMFRKQAKQLSENDIRQKTEEQKTDPSSIEDLMAEDPNGL